jgi:twitching motility protein PilT
MDLMSLLKLALESRASDMHIVPGMQPLFRIDGDLLPAKDQPSLNSEETKELIYSVLTGTDLVDFETNLAVDMGLYYPGIGNFRVNAFHQRQGVAAIFRIVPARVPSFDELGLPFVFKKILNLPHGLVLVTGATGSGKSTTLASMIDYINSTRPGHIITIEDPIEYLHNSKKSSVNQLEVGRDTKSFSAALRSSLRQDPDVIMLGEMRDLDSIRLALTAAETGHLVVATLHANTAGITINRIIDIFPLAERDQVRNILSETLQAVICQTLIKKVGQGRVAAFEVLLVTPGVRNLIAQGRQSHIESTIQTSGDIGMITFENYINDLVKKGIITKTAGIMSLSQRDDLKFKEER